MSDVNDERDVTKESASENIEADQQRRRVKSFVIRAGRMTDSQKQAITDLWPRFGLNLEDGLIDPTVVFGRSAPLVVEIGFGMGGSLAEMAKAHPDKDYIGIEVHAPGVGNLLKLAEADSLDNLRIYQADAIEVLNSCIADQCLAAMQIYFPDPWHKKKHHKRRLIQLPFVEYLRSKIRPEGILHLATDWEPYAEQMLEVMEAAPGYANAFGVGQWAEQHERPETKFERRGQRLGHGVWDLIYTRQ